MYMRTKSYSQHRQLTQGVGAVQYFEGLLDPGPRKRHQHYFRSCDPSEEILSGTEDFQVAYWVSLVALGMVLRKRWSLRKGGL